MAVFESLLYLHRQGEFASRRLMCEGDKDFAVRPHQTTVTAMAVTGA